MAITYPVDLPSTFRIAKSIFGLNFLNRTFESAVANIDSFAVQNEGKSDRFQGAYGLTAHNNNELRAISAFLNSLNGVSGTFNVFDPDRKAPLNASSVSVTNLALWSEQFDNAAYSKLGGSSVAANTLDTTDPLGGNNADKFTAGSSNFGGIIRQAGFGFSEAQDRAHSVYVKKGNHRYIGLRLSSFHAGDNYDNIDLDTGTIINSITGATFRAQFVGDGWWRLAHTGTLPAGPDDFVDVAIVQDAGGETAYTPAGTEYVYLFGTQVESGLVMNDYVGPTTASSATGTSPLPGSASVDGASQAGTTLATKDWNVDGLVLNAGDLVQVETQLYEMTKDIYASSGKAVLQFNPAIRLAPADHAIVITDNPKCVARLARPFQAINTDHTKKGTILLEWEEAI